MHRVTLHVSVAALLWTANPIMTMTSTAQETPDNITIVFAEDFADLTLPGWRKGWKQLPDADAVTVTRAAGPDGRPALSIESSRETAATATFSLPTEQIQGQAVLVELWRKPDNVKTGKLHYLNAKSMLIWQEEDAQRSKNPGTPFTDFSGTSDWERHAYVVQLPDKLEWAQLTIGLQACTGKASYAALSVRIDPRFPSQQVLERYREQQRQERYRTLSAETAKLQTLPGGLVQVLTDDGAYVPIRYWNDAARNLVLDAQPVPTPRPGRRTDSFGDALAAALAARAQQLVKGLDALPDPARNDRVFEIASLSRRFEELQAAELQADATEIKVEATSEQPVRHLIFGNNVNAEHWAATYDSERAEFATGILTLMRPMGITFMRYPGGCNADVFNWRDGIGPIEKRGHFINYHHGHDRGPLNVGVDEFLRLCEAEGMEPIITTAFLPDDPRKIDLESHPKAKELPYIGPFLATAPERVQLAADWVEYCNSAATTPMGRLRAQNGHPEPYGVTYWEIGNESWGADRVGSTAAESYARAFPNYVAAMKARDPSIQIVMNGAGHKPDWNDTLLHSAGTHADAFQIHIYRVPKVGDYDAVEGNPRRLEETMRAADTIPAGLSELEGQMLQHLGRTLPVFVTEFGMGNAKHRGVMVSLTSTVLVADMIRTFLEQPLIQGANKWTLYGGYWFSQITGPNQRHPSEPYYFRPEQVMHTIYARLRSATMLEVDNGQGRPASAVVFKRAADYGVVLISRKATGWQRVQLRLSGAQAGSATCFLVTGGHPMLGNDNDHELVRAIQFEFDYAPGAGILLPANSVMGLLIRR